METAGSNEQNFFRKKYTTSIAFLAGVLLFLLPFAEIRCNDKPVAQNTGLGLAIGSDFKASKEIKSIENPFGGESQVETDNDLDGKLYFSALAALLLGIIGIIVSYQKKGLGNINSILAVIAALSMIILLIQLKADINNKSANTENTPDEFGKMKFTAEFTIWYYLSLISFLVAAFLSYKRNQLGSIAEEPPKNAPQLDLQNPGDQSDFPKAASESELG